MREIIFKAKRFDNGEWVKGDLVHEIRPNFKDVYTAIRSSGKVSIEVVPETVCQFTGLKDKNGNKIFEGDTTKAGNIECIIRYAVHEFVAEWQCKRGEKRSPAMVFRQHEITGNIHD